MCDDLRDNEQKLIKRIFTVLLFLMLLIIGYCFVTEARATERGWKSKYITVTATAYCPCKICCGQKAIGKTATGRDASKPGIAVDPKIIPHRARIDCSEYKRNPNWNLPDDTGSAIKGNRIDLRMETHQEAKEFGRKNIQIRVWMEE